MQWVLWFCGWFIIVLVWKIMMMIFRDFHYFHDYDNLPGQSGSLREPAAGKIRSKQIKIHLGLNNCHDSSWSWSTIVMSPFHYSHLVITSTLHDTSQQSKHAHTIIVYNMCIFLAITHSTLVHHDHHLAQPRKKIILLSSLTLSSSSISISFFSTIFFSLFSVSESALRVDT